MKNKKGFTMIELLAVIVVLGLIISITIPEILGVIHEADSASAKNSAINYVDAINKKLLFDKISNDGFKLSEGYHNVTDIHDKYDLKLSGTLTTKGNIRVNDKKKIVKPTLCIKNFKIGYDGEKATVLSGDCIDMTEDTSDGNFMVACTNGSYFWTSAILSKIKSVKFVHSVDTTGAINTWDLSEEQNNSITGWIKNNTQDSNYYDLYIGSDKVIYANANSYNYFADMTNVTSFNFSNFSTSNIIYTSYMFDNCSSLTGLDVSNFSTSNVINMDGMFYNCSSLTILDISSFDTSNVTAMSWMFYNCSSLTSINISNFNTSKVNNMSSMFGKNSSLTGLDVSNFDTSNVISMDSMFYNCESLTTLDVSDFDTSNVINMRHLFSHTPSLISLDVSSFDTSKVTDMYAMFNHVDSLSILDVSNFKTHNVTNMGFMFSWSDSLTTLDLSNFDTSKATDMSWMFTSSHSLSTIYVSNLWNTTNANISNMFTDTGTNAVTLK